MLVSAGGGGLPRKPSGWGWAVRGGEVGRARGGVCWGLGRVARHDRVRSVARHCAFPQHVSPKSRAHVEPGPSTCCRWRVHFAGGGILGCVAARGAFGWSSGCCCVAPLVGHLGSVLLPRGSVRSRVRGRVVEW